MSVRSSVQHMGWWILLGIALGSILHTHAMHPAPDRRNIVASDSVTGFYQRLNLSGSTLNDTCSDWLQAYRNLSLEDTDTMRLVDIYRNLANLLVGIESYEYAVSFYEKAYALCEKKEATDEMFMLLYDLARTEILLKHDTQAFEYLETAQKLGAVKNPELRNLLLADAKGLYYQMQGKLGSSIDYFLSALQSARSLNEESRYSELHAHLAGALQQHGLFTLANLHLDSALMYVPPIHVRGETRQCDIAKAQIYSQLGDYASTKEALFEAIELATEAKNAWLEARFSLWLATILQLEGKDKEAYSYLKTAQTLSDSLNLEITLTTFMLNDKKAKHDRDLREQEKVSLRTLLFQNQRAYTIAFLLAAFLFGIIFLFISFRSYRRLREQERDLQIQRRNNIKKNSDLILNFAHTENLRTEIQYKNSEQERSRQSVLYKNSLIMNSIEYANTIQLSLRPHQNNMSLRFPDHCIIYRPSNIVGGDLLWFADLPDKSIFILADCSGHEVAGAALSFIVYMQLNQIVRESGITSPAEIISRFAGQFYEMWKDSNESFKMQSNVKMGVLTVDHLAQTATFAGASQSLFFSRDRKTVERSVGKMHTISSDTPFVVKREELQLVLDDNVAIYMTTDGFIEQPNKDNIKIGSQRLQRFLEAIQDLPMEAQRRKLLAYFARHRIGMPQVDDVTLLGFTLRTL
ncbi:MAG: SpoIIE family protein phosphatase [Bacteroides sp.]